MGTNAFDAYSGCVEGANTGTERRKWCAAVSFEGELSFHVCMGVGRILAADIWARARKVLRHVE